MVAEFEVGRKPDYKLSALSKGSEHRGNVGVAWKNENGTIAIRLNAFVVLAATQDLVLTLFANDDPKWTKKDKKIKSEHNGVDEIPF